MKSEGWIEYIEHSGIVRRVDAGNGVLYVEINDKGDCGACPASKLCGGFSTDKTSISVIEIETPDSGKYHEGESVTVRGSERLHRKAIMIATVIPSIVLVAVMVIVYVLSANQLAACLSGLSAMILFFVLLWISRDKIAHEFMFEVISPLNK